MHFKRILVKISGEALMGAEPYGISTKMVRFVAEEIQTMQKPKKKEKSNSEMGCFFFPL